MQGLNQGLDQVVLAHFYSRLMELPEKDRVRVQELATNLEPFRTIIPALISDTVVKQHISDLLENRKTLLEILGSKTQEEERPKAELYEKGDIVVTKYGFAEIIEVAVEGYHVAWVEPVEELDNGLLVDVTTGNRVHIPANCYILTSGVQRGDEPFTDEAIERKASNDEDECIITNKRYVFDLGVVPTSRGNTTREYLEHIRDDLVPRVPRELLLILRCDANQGLWKRTLNIYSQLSPPEWIKEEMPTFKKGEPNVDTCVSCGLERTLTYFNENYGGMGCHCHTRYDAYCTLFNAVSRLRRKNLKLTHDDYMQFEATLEHAEDVARTKYGTKRRRLIREDSDSEDEE